MDSPKATLQAEQQGVSLLLADAERVGLMLCISERLVWKMDASGQLPMAVQLGRRKLWCVAELAAWCKSGCPGRQQWEAQKHLENF